MLNPFPELLNYSFFAPLILRLFAGLIFLDLGILKFKGEKSYWIKSCEALGLKPGTFFGPFYGLLQVLGGVMLIMGFYTQVAALVLALTTLAEVVVEWRAKEILKRDLIFYLTLFVISTSLLITGAGALAFDLPL